MSAVRPVRLLIVDDTRTVRALLRAHLSTDPRIEVVGEAGDPYEARAQIKALNPDVVTLDVEMPKMNGLEFLEKLMRLRPTPVVMISTRTTEQSDVAVRALHEAARRGEPWQSGKAILAAAGSRSLKMSDVFKSKKNWRLLIESDGRGAYRLLGL